MQDLKEIDDLREDALPSTCDVRPLSGPAKYGQMGVPAAEEVLTKALKGVSFESTAALMIVDAAPKVGDFCHAFCKLRSVLSHNTPLVYVAMSDRETDSEWMQATLLEDLVGKVKAGAFSVPGTKPNQEMPADLLQPYPNLPTMNLLTTKGADDKKQLQIPAALVKHWATHAEFGSRFQGWLDDFLKTYEVTSEAETPAPAGQGGGQPQPSEEPPSKKARVSPADEKALDASFILDNDKVEGALLFDVKLAPKDALNFQLRAGHRGFLVNLLGNEVTLKGGTAVVGFGRGSFKLVKAKETMDEKAIPFTITSAEDVVCLNGRVMTIRDALQQQRKTKPEAGVCYHTVKVPEENASSFHFSTTHTVAYMPAGQGGKNKKDGGEEDAGSDAGVVTANNVAAREPFKTWESSPSLKLVWWVRWTVKGLSPVKPMLHIGLGQKLVLPPGKSYRVTAD